MINIKNANTITGERKNLTIDSEQDITIDASHLTIFPGLIDPHVHFRTPGEEHKENWCSAAAATIKGGYTTVCDMPNNIPACVTAERLRDKVSLIEQQLKQVDIPLKYRLYFGADKNNFDQIHKIKNDVVGIKVFMGSSTGDLLMDDDSSLHAIFALAAAHDLLVAVHAEDEDMIRERTKQFASEKSHHIHSCIRTPEVAAAAVAKATSLAKMYGTRLYILHVSTTNELELIAKAKQEHVQVYAETTPHHLFLNTNDYQALAGKAQMNPPLRSPEHQDALFSAIHTGLIDTIGSDHAPHLLTEKNKPYGQCPSGVPGVETNLPLLLNAHHQGLLSLEKIISLTCERPREMLNLPANDDIVLVDLNHQKMVNDAELKTKAGWSPFHGRTLTGWPMIVIANGKYYDLEN